MKNRKEHKNIWLAFVHIKAKKNYNFMDLIDFNSEIDNTNYQGAWANILIKSENIKDAIEIIPQGLDELNFEVVFIDKIENAESLIEYDEINEIVKSEVIWLSKSNYVFKISDKIFPYE